MPALFRLPLAAALPVALTAATPVLAQEPPPAPLLYASKGDLAAAMARAASAMKPGQTMASVPVLVLAPYRANVEYRTGPASGAVHEGQIEMVQVVEGSGTVTMGGTLDRTPAGHVVNGGTARHVAAGDVFLVPAGTPHAFNQIDGHLTLLTIKMPAP